MRLGDYVVGDETVNNALLRSAIDAKFSRQPRVRQRGLVVLTKGAWPITRKSGGHVPTTNSTVHKEATSDKQRKSRKEKREKEEGRDHGILWHHALFIRRRYSSSLYLLACLLSFLSQSMLFDHLDGIFNPRGESLEG